MYKTILALVALSAATGGWYYHDRTKLNGLECEVNETEISYNPSNTTIKPAVTWIIELSNSQWRLMSLNGMPIAEAGENKDHPGWIFPLRITDEAYILIEKDDHTYQNYHFTSAPLIVNRVTGALIGEHTAYDETSKWSNTTESKGHCIPIHIGAKL